jgi:hypothetical protein
MKRYWPYAVAVLGVFGALLAGCDARARQTILNGLESGTTNVVDALIKAYFQLIPGNTGSDATSTSWLDTAGSLMDAFA